MTYHEHLLDGNTHRDLLARGETDPIAERPFKTGDKVVVCARDRKIFLASTWWEMDCCCPCGSTDTLMVLNGFEKRESRGAVEEAVYIHRPKPAPVRVDLTRENPNFDLPWKNLGIGLVIVLLLAVFVFLALNRGSSQARSDSQKELPPEEPPDPPPIPPSGDETKPHTDPENPQPPDPPVDPPPEIPPEQPSAEAKIPAPAHPGTPRIRFRNEKDGIPLGDYGYEFPKTIKQVALYLEFEQGATHDSGQLEIRFYEPGGKPIAGHDHGTYYKNRYRPGGLAQGLRLDLKRQTRLWGIGNYSVEVWWVPISSKKNEPTLLGRKSFEVNW